ncbi:MAG: lytic transglycosylase domain-containing protein [Alicyclobacillaceae bacterium]|nr:lytic transglycosylase domain-containing protein [Alicyclobacillaceae bacterium]
MDRPVVNGIGPNDRRPIPLENRSRFSDAAAAGAFARKLSEAIDARRNFAPDVTAVSTAKSPVGEDVQTGRKAGVSSFDDEAWLSMVRLWAAERMAALPGAENNSTPGLSEPAFGDLGWWWLWEAAAGRNGSGRPPSLRSPGAPVAAETVLPGRPKAPDGAAGTERWMPLILQTAGRYGLDPALLRAVMAVESGGNPSARSPAGALGLMQLMPSTARSLGVDPLDPAQNLDGGARYLRDLLARFRGDVVLALAAYNAGPAAVERHGGIPPYPETREYVRRVTELYRRFR